jgi:hypothetical protein
VPAKVWQSGGGLQIKTGAGRKHRHHNILPRAAQTSRKVILSMVDESGFEVIGVGLAAQLDVIRTAQIDVLLVDYVVAGTREREVQVKAKLALPAERRPIRSLGYWR